MGHSWSGAWEALLEGASHGCEVLARRFGPILGAAPGDRPFVVAHLAQSLDGAVAMPSGESQWITGDEDLVHTHRLRALVDAVIVGAGTVEADDPRLTVRRCSGRSPVRVVIDPRGRLSASHKVFDEEAPTWRVCATEAPEGPGERVEVTSLEGQLPPREILAALAARGVRRVLVEGGGVTVGHFLAAGCVDRLHLVVAPMLVGGGRRSLPRPLGNVLAEVPRVTVQPEPLGPDWLFDCELRP